MSQQAPATIISLSAENIKRIRAVEVKPTESTVVIGGRNAQGKTSLLDCIEWALNGAGCISDVPVRRGEKKAQIILKSQEFTVTRRFTAAGGNSLEVVNNEGMKFSSPQKMLDRFTESLAFDPLEFIRMKKKDQFQKLQDLLGINTTKLDEEYKLEFERRTAKNRIVDDLKSVIQSLPLTGPARVDIRELLDRLSRGEQMNADVDNLEREVMEIAGKKDAAEQAVAAAIQRRADLENQIAAATLAIGEAHGTLAQAEANLATAEQNVARAERIAILPIKEEIAQIEINNQEAAKVDERAAKAQELAVAEDESKMITAHLDEIKAKRAKLLTDCKMPIPGIGFEADGITLNGLPLDQASGAEQLRMSVAVACAMNPVMRVMIIRDGSLLDEDGMRLLAEMATEHGAQIWIERVGDDGKCTVVIEDGSASPQVGAAEPADAAVGNEPTEKPAAASIAEPTTTNATATVAATEPLPAPAAQAESLY